ncbi:capZ-interacting protein [Scleropages formosus]|uniref:FAM21/CAPZIP domain-containing protein n=1 Tax=Scleropages formosus TaxID=113540 RepID=A0A8C9WCB2_SCLFO|nr:capZ-interacting protein [Scleropages formosus]
MEEPPVKPSVSKLAEKFKGQPFPIPSRHEEKPAVGSTQASKSRNRNSALIEKLQANLSLSPTSLLPLTRNPEAKLQPKPPGTTPPVTPPLTPTSPPQPTSEEEAPTGFETPAEGSVLPSFNKGRPRLSFKRRPPTRQHRKSCNEEVLPAEDGTAVNSPDASMAGGGQGAAAEAAEAAGEHHDGVSPGPALTLSPAPAAETGGDGDSAEKEAAVQEEDDVFAVESTAKEGSAGKEAPEEPLPAAAQEPQRNTQCGETAEAKGNQPRSPGD